MSERIGPSLAGVMFDCALLYHTFDKPCKRLATDERVEKAPRIVLGEGWHVHYVFFARAGFTDAARAEAGSLEASLVDLERLDADLRQALEKA